MEKKSVEEGKTIAIISYLTWVGLIIAFVMNNEKKNSFAKYHIRQSLGLVLAAFVLGFIFIIPILGWLVGMVGYLVLFIFWVMGLISAINGQEKPVPVIGPKAQEWFKGL